MIRVTFVVNTLVTFYLTMFLADVVYASGISDSTSPALRHIRRRSYAATRPSECEGDLFTYDGSVVGHMFGKLGSQPHVSYNASHYGKDYMEGTLFIYKCFLTYND